MFISKQQRLAFFEREPAIPPDGLSLPFARQAEVVHRVAGLVNRPQQTRKRIAGIEAGRDADVARDTLGEGVLALVEPAAVEGEAERIQHLERELALAPR